MIQIWRLDLVQNRNIHQNTDWLDGSAARGAHTKYLATPIWRQIDGMNAVPLDHVHNLESYGPPNFFQTARVAELEVHPPCGLATFTAQKHAIQLDELARMLLDQPTTKCPRPHAVLKVCSLKLNPQHSDCSP